MSIVSLCYRRVLGDLSSGILVLNADGIARVLEKFESIDFAPMMKKFAAALIQYPDAEGAIQRIDRPGLTAIQLSEDEVKLFREDPVEAIHRRIFTPETVRAASLKPPPEPAVSMLPPLEAGYDVRAECFGDVVFLRVNRDKEVECGCCGAWAKTLMTDRLIYRCTCGAWLPIVDWKPDLRWAGVHVFDLLGCKEEKYFLPRRWNTDGNWITRMKLGEMFINYVQEKKHAQSE